MKTMMTFSSQILIIFTMILSLFSPSASANFVCSPGPGGSETPIQTVRNFFWMAVGFPGNTEYQCFTQGLALIQDMVPKVGLIGDIQDLRTTINQAIINDRGSGTSCLTIPNSGSYTISSGITITYQVPLNTIPLTFPNGGNTYQKRIRYENTAKNLTSTLEFNCTSEQILVKTWLNLSNGPQYRVVYYDNSTSTKYIDFYFYDDRNFSDRLNLAIAIRVYPATETFKFWVSRSGYNPSSGNSFSAYRFTSTANYNTQKASFHYHDVSNEGRTLANYTGLTDINGIGISSVYAPDGSGGPGATSADPRQGCADHFSVATNNISSATLCAGLALEAPPNMAFGSSFSMQSVQENMLTGIQNIQ
jgi:hypothetical protein